MTDRVISAAALKKMVKLIVPFTLMAACGWSGLGPASPTPPQDCSTVSKQTWAVGPAFAPFRVAVGASSSTALSPGLEPQCLNSVASVVWASDKPSVASVLPFDRKAPTQAWVTGVAVGDTTVKARIVFSDGVTLDAQPEAVQVTPPKGPPTGSVLIAEGVVPVAAPPSHDQLMAWVPFKLPDSGFVEIVVDWDSPLDTIDGVLYPGTCSSIDTCAILITVINSGSKPISLAHFPLSAGAYTIRLDSLGPGAETLRYSVRFTSQ
jgi:hypothetical protein